MFIYCDASNEIMVECETCDQAIEEDFLVYDTEKLTQLHVRCVPHNARVYRVNLQNYYNQTEEGFEIRG